MRSVVFMQFKLLIILLLLSACGGGDGGNKKQKDDELLALGAAVSTPEDTAVTITLAASGGTKEVVAFLVVGAPAHGTLSGTAPSLTYTPAANFFGKDAIQFKVSQGDVSSEATVDIAVTAVNDAPSLEVISTDATLMENGGATFDVTYSDIDSVNLSLVVVTAPVFGSVSFGMEGVTYTPRKNYWGKESFTIAASDGDKMSEAIAFNVKVDPVAELAASRYQSLYVDGDGQLWTWGANTDFNLFGAGDAADGKTVWATPHQVNSDSDWTAVSGASSHVLALKADGALWGWGYNSDYNSYPLGRMSGTNIPKPICADEECTQSLDNIIDIVASGSSSFALTAEGRVLSFGDNTFAQLGRAKTASILAPKPVCMQENAEGCIVEMDQVKAIAANTRVGFAVRGDARVLWSWGNKLNESLMGTTLGHPQAGMAPVCLEKIDNSGCSVQLDHVVDVAAAEDWAMALLEDGRVVAWGYNFYTGTGVGNSEYATSVAPVCIEYNVNANSCSVPLTDAVAISAGGETGLVRRKDGTVWAWGINTYGELGDSSTQWRQLPTPVCAVLDADGVTCLQVLTDSVAIAAGERHSLFLREGGALLASGSNQDAQLGVGVVGKKSLPVSIPSSSEWQAVWANSETTFARKADGSVWSWGQNFSGMLGHNNGNKAAEPGRVCAFRNALTGLCSTYLGAITDLSLGFSHALSVQATPFPGPPPVIRYYVRGWGDGSLGKLGNGSAAQSEDMTSVCTNAACSSYLFGLNANLVKVAAGDFHSIALVDGTVWSWGLNVSGELGRVTPDNFQTYAQPVCQVYDLNTNCTSTLNNALDVAVGASASFALVQDPNDVNNRWVYAWGYNATGQLGNGTNAAQTMPKRVCLQFNADTQSCDTYLAGNIVKIGASNGGAFALFADGSLYGWGHWRYLTHTGNDVLTATRVCAQYDYTADQCVQYLANVVDFEIGNYVAIAMTADSLVAPTQYRYWSWAGTALGTLGNPAFSTSSYPVPVCNSFSDVSNSCVSVLTSNAPLPLAAGSNHFSVITRETRANVTNIRLKSWGSNRMGQIGDGTGFYPLPVAVSLP